MTLAIVFDSAGTLLKTVREVTDIKSHRLLENTVETTLLTFEDPDRLLVLLNISSAHLLESNGKELLSTWIKNNNISFGISCGRHIIDAASVEKLLHSDRYATVGDLQLAVQTCRNKITKENYLFALNAGLIVNTRTDMIEFGIASAGYPFPGVKALISHLHRKGIATFIASGDRTEKLELVADNIGIPRNRVYGVATPVTKAQVVTNLKQEYDVVMMVGDGINDLSAMRSADIAVLTLQQSKAPDILEKTADRIINDIREIEEIASELNHD